MKNNEKLLKWADGFIQANQALAQRGMKSVWTDMKALEVLISDFKNLCSFIEEYAVNYKLQDILDRLDMLEEANHKFEQFKYIGGLKQSSLWDNY